MWAERLENRAMYHSQVHTYIHPSIHPFPSVARGRWHRAWPAAETSLYRRFIYKTISKRCLRERHSNSESWVRRYLPSSVFCLSSVSVRGPRSMALCVAPWHVVDGTARGTPLKCRWIAHLDAKTISKRCRRVHHSSSESWVRRCLSSSVRFRLWPAIDGTMHGSVARERWHRAWLAAQAALCAGFAALRAWRDRCFWSLKRRSALFLQRFCWSKLVRIAVGGLCGP